MVALSSIQAPFRAIQVGDSVGGCGSNTTQEALSRLLAEAKRHAKCTVLHDASVDIERRATKVLREIERCIHDIQWICAGAILANSKRVCGVLVQDGVMDAEAAMRFSHILHQAVLVCSVCMGCNHVPNNHSCDYCGCDPRAVISESIPRGTMPFQADHWRR